MSSIPAAVIVVLEIMLVSLQLLLLLLPLLLLPIFPPGLSIFMRVYGRA